MNKQIIIVGIIAFVIGLIIGLCLGCFLWKCNIVCNKPYIRFEKGCCLDVNGNSICDSTTTTTTIPNNICIVPRPEGDPAVVSRVIDGDTIDLETGERVRLLGINAPERGELYYEEARKALEDLLLEKEVVLERDEINKDQYGRLLRYVYIDDLFVSCEMVRQCYATVYIIPPNIKHEKGLRDTWEEGKKTGLRLCNLSKCCINISYFHWNAEGNDCENLNDEYVTFINLCEYAQDITGWTVKDESSRDPYILPEFTLRPGAIVTLYTGCGTDTETELYWCSRGRDCNAIWNTDGDTLYLRDANGNLCIDYTYEGSNG